MYFRLISKIAMNVARTVLANAKGINVILLLSDYFIYILKPLSCYIFRFINKNKCIETIRKMRKYK